MAITIVLLLFKKVSVVIQIAIWKQKHPYNPSFSASTQVASFSNGGIQWVILKTAGNGGGGSTQTAGAGGGGGITVQQPPSGQSFCRLGSSQLLVTNLTAGIGYYAPVSSIGTGMYVKPKMLTVNDFEPLPLKVSIPVITIFITGKIHSLPE